MENIILKSIIVEHNTVEYNFSVSDAIAKYFATNKLSIVYDTEVSNVPLSILTIPFVANLIPIAWLTNATLWVEELDKTFYNSVKALKVAYQEMYYDFPFKGRLVSAKIIENIIDKTDSSLILFSGGLDAQTSFFRNKENIKSLCNIQGWYTEYNNLDEAADTEQEFAHNFAQLNNIDRALVKSNFATIINVKEFTGFAKVLQDQWWHGFNHSMAFISIAIPVAYLNGYCKIIIASSLSYGNNRPIASFPTTDSEFSFAENGRTIHDGFELSRHDKVKFIVDYQKKHHPIPLRVCSFNKDNCCMCEKCFRTITAIISEGGDIADYDFNIKGSKKEYFERVFEEKLALWGVKKEVQVYWNKTKEVMQQNLSIIEDKEFAQWFIDFDFITEKRKALRRYYRTNFWKIIRRKLKAKF